MSIKVNPDKIKPKPLAEQLDEDFKAQSPEVRAAFYIPAAAVDLALKNGDVEAAKLIIARAEVPEELKPVKNKMLEKFNANSK